METLEEITKKREETIVILEEIKRKTDQRIRYPGFATKQTINKWFTEIEALDMGIEQIQLAIDNQ